MSFLVKVIIILIVMAGVGVGVWLAAPLFYNKKVSEELPGVESFPKSEAENPVTVEPVALAEGLFQGADSFHQAAGTARLVATDGKKYIRFEDDFTVTNGPDLFVYLGNNGQYDADTNLGRLKGNVGSQNYEVPAEIDVSQYSEVWVWCRAFFVPFGHAVLQ